MPRLTPEEIKLRIADGSIFAISIDTAVFDGLPGQFDNTVLRKLDQFHDRDVLVVFSEIVAEEIKRHVARAAMETQRALNRAIRQQRNRWKIAVPNDLGAALALTANAAELAESQFMAFLETIHGEVVEATRSASIARDVLQNYFAEAPPFGASDKRKNEFPDAFALLSLEAFAREAGQLMLCIGPDKGWQDFGAASEHLVCVRDLEEALSYFNEAYQALAERIVDAWRKSTGGDFIKEIDRAFEYRLGDLNFHADGRADVEFESEPIDAVLQYIDPQSISQPTAIAADAETVTFTVSVEAVVEFTAQFNFFVMDSVDKDEVSLGSEMACVEKTVRFELTVTADRTFEFEPVFHEVEVTSRPFEVDFGHVEAFPNENPEHEKY